MLRESKVVGGGRKYCCGKCFDTGTVRPFPWIRSKVCPACKGNPESLLPPRPDWVIPPENEAATIREKLKHDMREKLTRDGFSESFTDLYICESLKRLKEDPNDISQRQLEI